MFILSDETVKEVIGGSGIVSYDPGRDALVQDLTLTNADERSYQGGPGKFILVINNDGVTNAFG